MILQNISNSLQELAPYQLAEDFDNVGLLVGDPQAEIRGILVCLDATEEVIQEAIQRQCNCIVSFHPIIFKGIKSFTGKTYVERAVIKAIQNQINILCLHTALDNVINGVNGKIAQRLGLLNTQVLIPKKSNLQKIQFYVPKAHSQTVKNAVFAAGAGKIGNYDSCSFSNPGIGSFRAKENAQPFVGEIGEIHKEEEEMVGMIFHAHLQQKIVNAMQNAHPYQTVAYEIYPILNQSKEIGMGQIGELANEQTAKEFLGFLKDTMQTQLIKHSTISSKPIKKVAVLGGSGAFAIEAAKAQKADALVTADLKYHDFFTAENQILLCDVGHYESEQFTKSLIVNHLKEKFANFAIFECNHNSNPVNYF